MSIRKPREADLVRCCLDYLRIAGVFAFRVNGCGFKIGSRFIRACSINGVSDILGLLPDGRFLAIECKQATGRVGPDQWVFLGNVQESKGVGLVVRSLDELIDALKKEGVRCP